MKCMAWSGPMDRYFYVCSSYSLIFGIFVECLINALLGGWLLSLDTINVMSVKQKVCSNAMMVTALVYQMKGQVFENLLTCWDMWRTEFHSVVMYVWIWTMLSSRTTTPNINPVPQIVFYSSRTFTSNCSSPLFFTEVTLVYTMFWLAEWNSNTEECIICQYQVLVIKAP